MHLSPTAASQRFEIFPLPHHTLLQWYRWYISSTIKPFIRPLWIASFSSNANTDQVWIMIRMNPSFVVLKINKKIRGQSYDEEQSGDVRRVLWLRVVPWDGTVSLWWKSVPNPRPRRALLSSHSSICPIWKVNKSLQFVSFAKWQICTTDNILVGLKNVFLAREQVTHSVFCFLNWSRDVQGGACVSK